MSEKSGPAADDLSAAEDMDVRIAQELVHTVREERVADRAGWFAERHLALERQ
ncbi:hypothetical protein [Nocardia rhamnosiphila]